MFNKSKSKFLHQARKIIPSFDTYLLTPNWKYIKNSNTSRLQILVYFLFYLQGHSKFWQFPRCIMLHENKRFYSSCNSICFLLYKSLETCKYPNDNDSSISWSIFLTFFSLFLVAWKLFSWDILSNHWIYLPQFSAIDCTMMVFHFESFIWILGSHGTFNDLCLFITVLAKCWRSKIPDKNWCSGTKDFFRDGCIVQK